MATYLRSIDELLKLEILHRVEEINVQKERAALTAGFEMVTGVPTGETENPTSLSRATKPTDLRRSGRTHK